MLGLLIVLLLLFLPNGIVSIARRVKALRTPHV
jgi:ABC-type branched-subunit amino acid transport system permease subunit